jgi:outer membrane receptor protein involved in Fe transport
MEGTGLKHRKRGSRFSAGHAAGSEGLLQRLVGGAGQRSSQRFRLHTNWTYIKSSHTIEFGGEFLLEHMQLNQDYLGDGKFPFGGAISGTDLLDFMPGRASGFTQCNSLYNSLLRNAPAAYVTDTWTATRRLTLSLGVRWEPWLNWTDAFNQVTNFSTTVFNQGVKSSVYPSLPPGLLVVGDPGVPRGGIASSYSAFDPRITLGGHLPPGGRNNQSLPQR